MKFLTLAGANFTQGIYAIFSTATSAMGAVLDILFEISYFAMITSQARGDNTAHVIVKVGGFYSLVNLLGVCLRFPVIRLIDSRPFMAWALLLALHALTCLFHYYSMRYVQCDTMNRRRLRMCVTEFVRSDHQGVFTVAECNWKEPILLAWLPQPTRHYGCSMGQLPPVTKSQVSYLVREGCTLAYDQRRRCGWISVEMGASEEELFAAAFQLEYMATTKGKLWPTEAVFEAFKKAAGANGWKLSAKLLGFGDYRYVRETVIR